MLKGPEAAEDTRRAVPGGAFTATLPAALPDPEEALPAHHGAGWWYLKLGYAGTCLVAVYLAARLLAGAGAIDLPDLFPTLPPLDLLLLFAFTGVELRVLRGLDRWEAGSWWATVATLAFGMTATLASAVGGGGVGEIGGEVVSLLLNSVWLRYFWTRREDFGIDLSPDDLLPG